MRDDAPTNPRRRLNLTRNATATAATALVAYRLIRAATASGFDLLTSAATVALIVAAVLLGARAHILKARAEADQEKQRADQAELRVVELRGNLLEGDEDRALWDSIPAATDPAETCAFGVNVVALNQYRNYQQAG